MDDDMNLLLNALDNENNENIMKLTSKEINDTKIRVLSDLYLDKEITINILTELKEYIYIDEIPEIKYGSFIRWIPLSNPDNIRLTKGGIVCDLILSKSGMSIKCKNYKNKFFVINMDKCLIFKKLTNQEKILISVSNYLNK